jgi:hypothetical protein
VLNRINVVQQALSIESAAGSCNGDQKFQMELI